MSSRIELKWENWDEFFYGGGDRLLQAEYDEYATVMPLKPHAPDENLHREFSRLGLLHICVARRRGIPVGCFFMTIMPDPESIGTHIACQGPWYLKRDKELVKEQVSVRLYVMARELAATLHASHLELHHPVYGRGKKLDKFFIRNGAIPVNVVYRLKLEGSPNA